MASKVVGEILDLRKQLEERDRERIAGYDEVLLNYGGATYKERRKSGRFPGLKTVVGRIFNARDYEEGDSVPQSPINLVRPAILNKVAFMALVPTNRVLEPPEDAFTENEVVDATEVPDQAAPTPEEPKDTYDKVVAFCDDLEAVLNAIHKHSNVTRRCWDTAWNLGAFGGSVLGVWPDIVSERPRIFSRSPEDFYPVCSDDGDGLDLDVALWTDEISGHEIKAKWGTDAYLGRKDIIVTQMMDRERMAVIIDDKELFIDVKHNLGFTPIVCVSNIGVPGSPFGDTDVLEALPVAAEINHQMKLINDMAAALINPTIAVKDPMNVPDDIAIGRGGKITMGPNGEVQLLGPLSVPDAFWRSTDVLQNWFDLICDNPAQLRGEGFGSVLTGKGFDASLSPVTARLQTRLNMLLSAWEQINRYTLLMWDKFPPVGGKIKSAGSRNKNMYYVEKGPKDFHINGEIWTETEVILSSSQFVDRRGTDIELLQLGQNEYLSWDTVAENLPYTTNKRRERRKIDEDRLWKARGMALANQMAASPATANVDPGSQEAMNYGLERGLTGELGAPPGPTADMSVLGAGPAAAPGEEMGGPETGGPEMGGEDPMQIFEQVFTQIDKLRGDVWIGGAPMLNPESVNEENFKLTVWITEPQDRGTITRAIESRFPELYGHLSFINGAPGDDEPAIQVAGGGGDVSPEEDEAIDMNGGVPPEMAGMPF